MCENNYKDLYEKAQSDLAKAREALINSQNGIQKSIEAAREDERKQADIFYEGEIQKLTLQANKVELKAEDYKKQSQQYKKQIDVIKEKTHEEIEKRVFEKIKLYDHMPDIIKSCDLIDQIVGGQITKISGIYEASNNELDDTSIQRIYGVYDNLLSFIKVLSEILKIDDTADGVKDSFYIIDNDTQGSKKTILDEGPLNFNMKEIDEE